MFKRYRNNIANKIKVEEIRNRLFKMIESMNYEELLEIEKMLDDEGIV